ncbi:hypothetical protein HOLleu_21205 [Holothuria leucospilota]|uniref:Uncharacterized protein n=1 Tax=Holothuria leucospilota TaxID=206669 RepID=A0A9Q1BX53_HOLLE|nr:hypothetical protein HOLleu_21205 [Holothuria leucospilota]
MVCLFPAVRDTTPGLQGHVSILHCDLCALRALVFMLHKSVVHVKGKATSSSRAGALLHLIQTMPEGTDVEAAAQTKEKMYTQPFLLAVGPPREPVQ